MEENYFYVQQCYFLILPGNCNSGITGTQILCSKRITMYSTQIQAVIHSVESRQEVINKWSSMFWIVKGIWGGDRLKGSWHTKGHFSMFRKTQIPNCHKRVIHSALRTNVCKISTDRTVLMTAFHVYWPVMSTDPNTKIPMVIDLRPLVISLKLSTAIGHIPNYI